ncbi:MAG: hypothetical protein OXH50_15480 [Gemmatimonadetes bacterium]|nr:hypothetical protein [Gemmatimonadota bacterium]
MTIERRNQRGKATTLDEVYVWYDAPGQRIHMTSSTGRGFRVEISANPEEPDGHPRLYRLLAECLGRADTPR